MSGEENKNNTRESTTNSDNTTDSVIQKKKNINFENNNNLNNSTITSNQLSSNMKDQPLNSLQNTPLQLASPAQISSRTKIIKLNIGGVIYQTTKSTLLKFPNTYFGALLEGSLNTTVDDGAFFIDRDGQFFAPILTWLRTNEISISSGITKDDVIREAKFYGFHNLVELLVDEGEEDDEELNNPFEPSKEVVDYVLKYWQRQEKNIQDLISNLNKDGYIHATIVILPALRQDFERPPQLLSEGTIGLHMNFTGLYLSKCPRVQTLLANCFRDKGYSGYFKPGERLEIWWWSPERVGMKRDGPVVYF